ncbi:HAUS augmin-like complex subunit 6 isoform X1 [Carassius auratus]|uniref:HAUS augmin-like complex subunit 6 isoform X1 n=1 Tax=Carassius auratus TaxID=7957 RepID=A0A6P6N349_CARAU|nr:HAUS augmin-like complex subunit 6 isoform X1 [Carassius auratus]
MSKLQKTNGKYLWWCLLCLEFRPDTLSKNIKHLNLGMNMFDKPNKEAFYIVIHFLFNKLNPAHAQDVFRHCWPIWDRKGDAEFRKVAFSWLQEIANEEGNAFPKVAASHLLSAFGPRFINLMLHLSKHVMLKTLKTFTTDDTWVPEAAAEPVGTKDLEMKRFHLVKRQFQRVTVGQDFLIQDYQKRAKGLETSLKDLDAEDAKYDHLLKEHDSNSDLKEDILAKKRKVQGFWTEADKVLSPLEVDRKVVESVIRRQVDQYILSGQDLSVKIPAVLHERMEGLSHQSSVGSLYKGGQPVLVCLLELLNEGLHVLSEERKKIVGPSVQLQHQDLQEHALLFSRSKENLKLIRWKLIKENAAEMKVSIGRLEEFWENKWAECLKKTPLISYLKEDSVFDFVSPMAPLSFEPASKASFDASIILQYPYKLPELLEQPTQRKPEGMEADIHLEPEVHLEPEIKTIFEEGEYKGVLLSSDSCFSPKPVTCDAPLCETPLSYPVKVKSETQTPRPIQASHGRNLHSKIKTSVLKNKAEILDLECDNLANQFAEAVIESPVNTRSDVDLGQLLNVISDPFSARKQLCRTPESLIKDVRSSWRKAVEEGMAEKKQATWNQQDSLSWLKTPMAEVNGPCTRTSPEPSLLFSATLAENDTPPPVQQGSSLHSTVSWDSSGLETLNSQRSSDIIKFSIAQEELPDLFEDDLSFNSDGSAESRSNKEREEELILSPAESKSLEGKTPLLMAQVCFEASLDKSPFNDSNIEKSPVHSRKCPGLSQWTTDERLFSLDLDKLESFSPPPPVEKLTLLSLVNLTLDEF